MKENIEIKAAEGVSEIIIREGKATEIKQRGTIALKGTIVSAKNFYTNRKGAAIDAKTSHVVVSREDLKVEAVFNAESAYPIVVNGEAVINPEIDQLGIMMDASSNPKQFHSPMDLAKHVKFMRSYFSDKTKHATVLVSLEKFKTNFNVALEKSREQNGNRKDSYELVVNTDNLVLDFTLELPVFIGGEKKKFKVEINYELRDRAVTLWLESVELKELIDVARNEMIDVEIAYFNKEEIVVIEQ